MINEGIRRAGIRRDARVVATTAHAFYRHGKYVLVDSHDPRSGYPLRRFVVRGQDAVELNGGVDTIYAANQIAGLDISTPGLAADYLTHFVAWFDNMNDLRFIATNVELIAESSDRFAFEAELTDCGRVFEAVFTVHKDGRVKLRHARPTEKALS